MIALMKRHLADGFLQFLSDHLIEVPELARATGLSRKAIYDMCNGTTTRPRPANLKLIKEAINKRLTDYEKSIYFGRDDKGTYFEVRESAEEPDFPDVSFLDDGTPEDAKSIQEFRTAFASFTPEQKSVFVEMMQILGNAPSDERTRVLQSFHQIVDTVFEKHKVKK